MTGTINLPLPESIGKLSVAGTLTYTSEQVANGSVPGFFTPLGGGILPDRTLLNLNVNWNNVGGMPVDASFFVTNITNKVYAVNTGGGWNSSGIADMLMGEPRMVGFRLKYSFGN
jgi:iron complex outermembrane receptor protein